MFRRAVIAAVAASAAVVQMPAVVPAFEVASIRPSIPLAQAMPMIRQGKLHAGINIDQARVDIKFQSLKDLICAAYKVKPFQVAGPDWLGNERFEIQAKLPDGASADQVPRMLQALLADRFKMTAHNESRDFPVYVLVVGRNGPRLKESVDAPDAPDSPATLAPAGSQGQLHVNSTANGTVVSGADYGVIRMTTSTDGVHLDMSKAVISGLATMLAKFVGRPVVDRTGLTGRYDIVLDLPSEEIAKAARTAGVSGDADEGGAAPQVGSAADPGSPMFRPWNRLVLN